MIKYLLSLFIFVGIVFAQEPESTRYTSSHHWDTPRPSTPPDVIIWYDSRGNVAVDTAFWGRVSIYHVIKEWKEYERLVHEKSLYKIDTVEERRAWDEWSEIDCNYLAPDKRIDSLNEANGNPATWYFKKRVYKYRYLPTADGFLRYLLKKYGEEE